MAFGAKKKEKTEKQASEAKTLNDLALDKKNIPNNDVVPDKDRLFHLPTSRFYVDKQVRNNIKQEDIYQRAWSIVENKQFTPISVHPADENGNHLIEKGECRWRAWMMIEEDPEHFGYEGECLVDAVVDEDAPTYDRATKIIGQFVENDQRSPLPNMDSALVLKELHEMGMSYSEIARRVGWMSKKSNKPDKPKVIRFISLTQLPEEGRYLVEKEIITDVHSINYLRQINDLNEKKFHALVSIIKDRGMTRKRLEEEYNQCKLNAEGLQAPESNNSDGDQSMPGNSSDPEQDVDPNKGGEQKPEPQAEVGKNSSEEPSSTTTTTTDGEAGVKSPSAPEQPKTNTQQNVSKEQSNNTRPMIHVEWNQKESGVLVLDQQPEEEGMIFVKLDSGQLITAEPSELNIESFSF